VYDALHKLNFSIEFGQNSNSVGIRYEYNYMYKQSSTNIFLIFYNYFIISGCDNNEWIIQREVNIWGQVTAHMYNFMLMPFHVQNYIIKTLFSTEVLSSKLLQLWWSCMKLLGTRRQILLPAYNC